MGNVHEVVAAWKPVIESIENWEAYVEGVAPKDTTCGPVYELANPINRPSESFAIADMRELDVAEPHHHTNAESEIYFIITGVGVTVVGGHEQEIRPGSVIVTPPDTAHFTIPKNNLVIAVVNTPPFDPKNVVVDTETDPKTGFDKQQFERLTK